MKKEIKKNEHIEPKNLLLILGVIYTLFTILAITSYVFSLKNISSTPITFGGVIGAIWWQIIMIILFAITYLLYKKKKVLGSLLEIIMGIAMLVYMIISVAMMGANLFAILIELIYPLILVFHGLNTFKKYVKQNKKSTI